MSSDFFDRLSSLTDDREQNADFTDLAIKPSEFGGMLFSPDEDTWFSTPAAARQGAELYIVKTESDCDHTTTITAHKFATRIQYKNWIHNVMDNREGRVSIEGCNEEDYNEFENSSRDLALEAFENGHPHYIGEAV